MERAVVKPYIEAVRELGAEVVGTTMTGKSHYKVVVSSRGHTRFFITAGTPSDKRGVRNFAADVRRWMRTIENA